MKNIKKIKRPRNYFSQKENCERELRELAKIVGKPNILPSFKQIEARSPALKWWIQKLYKDIKFVAKESNLALSIRQQAQFISEENKNFDYVKSEILKVVKKNKLDRMPCGTEISESLRHAINKYHGGIYELSKKIGLRIEKKEQGYWKNFENVKNHLQLWIEENNFPKNIMPSTNDLKINNGDDICQAIIRHHGGFYEVSKFLKKEMPHNLKPTGFWREWKVTAKAIKEVANSTGRPNIMPTYDELGSAIVHAINRHHGGFLPVANKLELLIIRNHNNYEIRRLIDPIESSKETFLYVVNIISKNEYRKIGIAYSYQKRAKDDDFNLYPTTPLWQRPFRRDVAWAIEQKILNETINSHPIAAELKDWEGWSELRTIESINLELIDNYCNFLEKEIDRLGWHKFVVENNLIRESDLIKEKNLLIRKKNLKNSKG